MRNFTILLFLSFILAGLPGCGNSNDNFFTATPNGSSGGGNSNTGNDTGTLVFNFARAQTVVPGGTVELRFEFFDSDGQLVRTETRPFAAQITIEDVSVAVTRVEVSSLDDEGVVLDKSSSPVSVQAGATQDITFDVRTSFDQLIIEGGPLLLDPTGTAQLTAVAEFTDGSEESLDVGLLDITSNNTSVATVSGTGLVTAVSPGTTTIDASYTVSGTGTKFNADPVTVTVTEASLQSLSVTPDPVSVKAGGTVQLDVEATLSDNSTQTLNPGDPMYQGNNTAVATISNSGLVTGVSEGTTSFTVTHTIGQQVTSSPVTINVTQPSLDAITVTPDPVMLTTAGTEQFTIEGTFSDSSTDTVDPSNASFTGHSTAVVTINSQGVITPVAAGQTSVTVSTTDPVTNSTVSDGPITITVVEDVTLDSLTITPDPVSVKAGDTVQLSVEAEFSDNTSQTLATTDPTYDVVNSSIATINASGLVSGVAEGSTTFTVSYTPSGGSEVTSDPVTINVTPPTLDSITVTPDPICATLGNTTQIALEGGFSDGSTQSLDASNATYTGHNTSVVTIDSDGLITPVALGETTVTIEFDDPVTNNPVSSGAITIKVVGPAIALTGANTFDTDTGELNGTVPPGWNGVVLNVADFELAGGATLDITGTLPFQASVCGDVTIAGNISANGQDGGDALAAAPGAGGEKGPGGFDGGLGGGVDDSNRNGSDGSGNGGGGGGETLGLQFSGGLFFGENENGGGGAGHSVAGQVGFSGGATGTPGAGGPPYTSIPTMLLGGSGGGGGSAFIDAGATVYGGGGGGGGGGLVSFIADGVITVSGIIDCSGGDGGDQDPDVVNNAGAGGGGGSGGSIQLLAPMAPSVSGTLNVSGGAGGDGVANGGSGAAGRTNVGTL